MKKILISLTILSTLSFVSLNAEMNRYAKKRFISRTLRNAQRIEKYINSKKSYLKGSKKLMFIRMRRFNLQPEVKKALALVKRERFSWHRTNMRRAYENVRMAYAETPLPIGYGQTISSPNMVAIMTKLANPKSTDKILEIGTGSGYQSALLSKICKKIYSIEIIEKLGLNTKQVYKKYGYNNIKTKIADGYYGWKEYAPFDKILVTAGTNHIPPSLIRQLKRGGIMLVPVGPPYGIQKLIELRKDKNGRVTTKKLMHVRFVPMTGQALKKYKQNRKN